MDEDPNKSPESSEKLQAPKRRWLKWPKTGRLAGLIAIVSICSLLGLIGPPFAIYQINIFIYGPPPEGGGIYGQREWREIHGFPLALTPTIIGGLAIGGFVGWAVFSSLLINREPPTKRAMGLVACVVIASMLGLVVGAMVGDVAVGPMPMNANWREWGETRASITVPCILLGLILGGFWGWLAFSVAFPNRKPPKE
jgi:hypothetical protein